MVGANCYIVIVNLNSNPVTVDFTITRFPVPPVAKLELTSPEFYGATRLKYGQSLVRYEMAQTSSAAESSAPDPLEDLILVPLNDVSLEPKQGMVLSFMGQP